MHLPLLVLQRMHSAHFSLTKSLSFALPSPLTTSRVLNPPDTRKVLQNLTCVGADEVSPLVLLALCKSSGLDQIPTTLVKDCIDILITPIPCIINLLLTEGSFLAHFKCGLVYHLLKKDLTLNKDSMKIYQCPILASFPKVLKKVVVNQLNSPINS